jgi:hypothetical protein
MNGKPGDHPLTDILTHNLRVYGEPTDSNIRKLARLMDYHRLYDWLDCARRDRAQDIPTTVQNKLSELLKEAKERGWEVE